MGEAQKLVMLNISSANLDKLHNLFEILFPCLSNDITAELGCYED